jgi:hypothetical protein
MGSRKVEHIELDSTNTISDRIARLGDREAL